jgi:hypothetical protein
VTGVSLRAIGQNVRVSTVPERVKPSAAVYLLPVLVFIAGSVLAVVAVVNGAQSYKHAIDNFARVPANGGGTVAIKKAGSFTIYWEDPSDPSFRPLGATVTMTKEPGGTQALVRDYGNGTVTYDQGSHHGVALKTVKISEPGNYRVTVNGLSTGELAIGHSVFGLIARGVGLFFLIGGLAFVVAVILAIVIAVKRGKSKRRIRAAQFGTGAPWGGQPGPGYGPPAGQGPPPGGYGPPPGQGPPPGGYRPPPGQGPPPGGYRPAPVGAPPGQGSPTPGGFGPPPGAPPAQQPAPGGWGAPAGYPPQGPPPQGPPPGGAPGGPGGFAPPPGAGSPGGFPPPPPR